MNNKKMSSGQITGVGCDVTNCKYNTIDCKCSASQIKVQSASRAYQGLQAALVSRFSSLPRAFR